MSIEDKQRFDEFFARATGFDKPYDYQRRLALAEDFPEVLGVPTGVGKTAAVVLAWLFRRRDHASDAVRQSTPRRLVYCLPMRTLVEQTKDEACKWVENLAEHDDSFRTEPVSVHVLMGGAEKTDWDNHPERDAILIGTQDMLLSRALNRGYGMSRYRWPMHFALLNNDCLWVLDETQLMGVGLTTSAQIQGLRTKLNAYGTAKTLWMSATLDGGGLSTVDYPQPDKGWHKLELEAGDREAGAVQELIEAVKPCCRANVALTPDSNKCGYHADLAEEIVQAHHAGTLTLMVVNRVDRAQALFQAIEKQFKKNEDRPEVFLIHSRFRKCDRDEKQQTALNEETILPDGPGRIVIATQAIEAGIDISATTLFTELAPWSSLVQRFGRCNRRGICGKDGNAKAQVFWIDIDTVEAKKMLALPYSADELDVARGHILAISDVGPKALEAVAHKQPRPIVHTIRRKDLLELWDTTPDLAGNDLDISRYIRDSDDTDVQVYWREWNTSERNDGGPPDPKDERGQLVFPSPSREELCAVSIGRARDFLKKIKNGAAWRWDPLEANWRKAGGPEVRPGMVLLLCVDAGGYDTKLGWTGKAADKPDARPPAMEEGDKPQESMGDEELGKRPLLLTEHLQNVVQAAERLGEELGDVSDGVPWEAILTAARWHDVGKAHPAFQIAMRDGDKISQQDPKGDNLWAKSGSDYRLRYRIGADDNNMRPGFRHELAGALVWLGHSDGEADADLVAFLIAAHHGKVRGSIRSLPNEKQPVDPEIKFARGLWERDEIPPVDLGNGRVTGEVTVNLSLMELGEDERGRPSWLARVLKLRKEYGPFRLAYLETLLIVADWHGSNEGGTTDV